MNITLYNTMTSKKEEFKPINEGKVGMYVCGVTVYDYTHIGHGRSSVAFDVIRRFFEYKGYDVTFVKNFTDVDDKIINRANENHEAWSELSERFIKEHDTDMDSLYIKRPTYTPMATKYIEKMINYCERLIEKGNAYAVDGDVYFRVNSFKEYGKLSGRNLEDMMAGARVDVNDKKENPLDFALWKAAKPGEPSWTSPWGQGRPGWHIECSVMSEAILGSHIDIHGGGQDLIFPHHENEIAQSEAISCSTFANYWIHNGFVNINKEKMSKSLNNFLTIDDVLKEYNSNTIRFFILTNHYRMPVEFNKEALDSAKAGSIRLINSVAGIKKTDNLDDSSIEEFKCAMDDDLNTSKALAVLFSLSDKFKKTNDIKYANTLITLGEVLGFDFSKKELSEKELKEKIMPLYKMFGFDKNCLPELVLGEILAQRDEARKNKDWQKSDLIRDELIKYGITVKDSKDGSIWEAC